MTWLVCKNLLGQQQSCLCLLNYFQSENKLAKLQFSGLGSAAPEWECVVVLMKPADLCHLQIKYIWVEEESRLVAACLIINSSLSRLPRDIAAVVLKQLSKVISQIMIPSGMSNSFSLKELKICLIKDAKLALSEQDKAQVWIFRTIQIISLKSVGSHFNMLLNNILYLKLHGPRYLFSDALIKFWQLKKIRKAKQGNFATKVLK